MTTSFDSIAKLSEQQLLDHFAHLVARDRCTTAELLVAIGEIDERRLWAVQACSSMFTFCMDRFHMSEQVTAKRIWAARTARRFPVVLEMVARGELHLGAIHLLAKHLTDENHAAALDRAKHKSCREVERLVAELAPQADVPSRIRALPRSRGAGAFVDGAGRDAASGASAPRNEAWADIDRAGDGRTPADRDSTGSVQRGAPADGDSTGHVERRTPADGDSVRCVDERRAPANGHPACASRMPTTHDSRSVARPIVALSPRRYKIEITVDEATHDKLRSLQDLLARSGTGRDPAAIISRAIDVLIDRTLTRKAAWTERPKSSRPAAPAERENTDLCKLTTSATPTNPAKTMHPVKSMNPVRTMNSAKTTNPAKTMNPANPVSSVKSARIDPRGPTTTSMEPARTGAHASDIATTRHRQRSRNIPASVRREVWRRDSGRCCYTDARGRRCGETRNVEFHHKHPFALGGPPTPENIELRCTAHNQLQADLDFGRSFMDARRGNRPCESIPCEA